MKNIPFLLMMLLVFLCFWQSQPQKQQPAAEKNAETILYDFVSILERMTDCHRVLEHDSINAYKNIICRGRAKSSNVVNLYYITLKSLTVVWYSFINNGGQPLQDVYFMENEDVCKQDSGTRFCQLDIQRSRLLADIPLSQRTALLTSLSEEMNVQLKGIEHALDQAQFNKQRARADSLLIGRLIGVSN